MISRRIFGRFGYDGVSGVCWEGKLFSWEGKLLRMLRFKFIVKRDTLVKDTHTPKLVRPWRGFDIVCERGH